MSSRQPLIGSISKLTPSELTVRLDSEIDLQQVRKLANGTLPKVQIEVIDNRRISYDQRAKIFALINDLCDYTGDVPEIWEQRFKWITARTFGLDDYSLSNCSVTVGNYTILTILNFMFEENIPFKTKTWDSIPSEYPKQRLAIKRRMCVICGKRADLAHYDAVGRRSRELVDHRDFYFMSLCRAHHTEQHTIGVIEFCKKYHIKPIKLSGDDLVSLGVMTRKHLNELEAKDND